LLIENALAALLFRPEFYQAAVANSGGPRQPLDKIWWNEQWMGWPVGPWYSEKLKCGQRRAAQGTVLLVMGEMDNNLPRESTPDRLLAVIVFYLCKLFEISQVCPGRYAMNDARIVYCF
jgi:hypothetical protein